MAEPIANPDRGVAVVVGCSAGGTAALCRLLPALPADFAFPVMVAQHLSANSDGSHLEVFAAHARLPVVEPLDKQPVEGGRVYVAPPDYHLLVEQDFTFALSQDDPLHHSRPAIDVLFESAADVWGSELVGCLLTGASQDGSAGLARIAACGGFTIVENPASAECAYMPRSALNALSPDRVLDLGDIGACLAQLRGAVT